jgi:tetratricopeptide (TPR) repeat protein
MRILPRAGLLGVFLILAALGARPAFAATGPETPPPPAYKTASSVIVLHQRADEYVKMGNYKAAAPLVAEALEIDPAYFPLWRLKAELLRNTGHHDEAEEAVRILIDKDPGDANIGATALEIVLSNPKLASGDRARRLGLVLERFSSKQAVADLMSEFLRKEENRKFLPTLLTDWPQFPASLPEARLILDHYVKGATEQAFRELTAVQANSVPAPLLGSLCYLIAENLARKDMSEKALGLLAKARSNGYSAVDCADLAGRIHAQKKRFAQAADAWEPLWRESNDPAMWIVRLADARQKEGNFAKMKAVLTEGLAVFPKNASLQGKYIYVLYKLGEDAARTNFELRLDGLNEQVGLSYGRALIFTEKGDLAAAREEKNKAVLFAEARTGTSFEGYDLEDWLKNAGMIDGDVYLSEALALRDRGWGYWQEGEYRRAHQVWLEALDLGIPQVRPFIMNITTRLLEVGMNRQAMALLKKYEPDVSPFSFAHRLRLKNRWDIVSPLLEGTPSGRYSAWTTLYRAYGALKMGDAEKLARGLEELRASPAPQDKISFSGFDDEGRIVAYTLKPADYAACLAEFTLEALRQKNPEMALEIMEFPHWNNAGEEVRSQAAEGAAALLIQQNNADMFNELVKRPEWNLIPSANQAELLRSAAYMQAMAEAGNSDFHQAIPVIRRHYEMGPNQTAAILDFAKILSWSGELSRADTLFKEAAEAGLDPKEVYYFHARNAQYEGDVPTALELTRAAVREDPGHPRVQQLEHDVKKLLSPRLSVTPSYWKDSDGRSFHGLQAWHFRHLNEETLVFGGAGLSRWSTGGESLNGITPALGARWYHRPEHWLEASIGGTLLNSNEAGPMFSGGLQWHGPLRFESFGHANGTYDLSYNVGPVETLEAVKNDISSHGLSASAALRAGHFWDVESSLLAASYTDGNHTLGGRLRGLYRFSERPLLRAGYLVEIADSRENPPEYYAPKGYMQHAAVLDYRHYFNQRNYINLWGTYGLARSENNDWHEVWRANANVNWLLNENWNFSLGYGYLKLPDYWRESWQGTISYTF